MKTTRVKAAGMLLSLAWLFNIFLLPASTARGAEVVNQDGAINQEVFDRDWQKYSDFDDRIPLESKSWEVQQYLQTLNKLKEVKLQIFVLQRDMEIDRLTRLKLREYKKNLVQNIKANLLKSFWRLSYITYQTVKTGKDVGKAYAGLFESAETLAETVEAFHNGLTVIKDLKPEADTDLGKNAETIMSLLDKSLTIAEDPKKTAEVFVQHLSDKVDEILPSADLTEEEIGILRSQHLQNRLIDDALQNSYLANRERRAELDSLEAQARQLEEELARWEAEEKQRVADMLVEEFKKNQNEGKPAEDPGDTGGGTGGESGEAPVEDVLVGDWSGSWVITEVHIGGPQGEAERARVVGKAQPIQSRVEKDAQGQYVIIDLIKNTSSPLNINGNQFSVYNEVQGVYARQTGVISDDGRKISGTIEMGDAAGLRYSGTWEVIKN